MNESLLFFEGTDDIRISLFILFLNFDLNVVHEQCSTILSNLVYNSHIRGTVCATFQVL